MSIDLGWISTVAKFFRANARKYNRGNVWKATRKRESWARQLSEVQLLRFNTRDLPYIGLLHSRF